MHASDENHNMFDIHSHIIYGVDDGARTLDEALELVSKAAAQGVTDIIATPHYYLRHPSDPETIRERLEELKEQTRAHDLEVNLYEGNEVLWFDSMPEKLKSGEIIPLAGSRYTLVEFYPGESYRTILNAVRKLREAGYRPIIAHAERFEALADNGLSEVIRQGAYIQLSVEPFGGSFLNPVTRFCRNAAKDGEVHFLGSDMHRTDKRPPVLNAGLKWIEKHCPESEEVVSLNAGNIPKDRGLFRR